MKSIFILLGLVVPYTLLAQPGFNTTPDFGYFTNHFENLIVHNDTVVAYGSAYSDTFPYKQCLFVARFDSSGTPLDYNLICDSLGGHLTMAINWSDIVTTSDGGYGLTGATFDRHNGIFVKLRNDLSVEFVQEYPDSVNLVEFYNSIVELPDGYLLGGYLQTPNYLAEAFLRRVDKQGNSIWFSYYGKYAETDLFSSYRQLNDSIVAYIGGYVKDENSLSGRGPWIVLFNTNTDEVAAEWRPVNAEIGTIHYLNPLPNGKWFLYGKKTVFINPQYTNGVRPYWALMDTAFDVEEMRLFGPGMYISNFLWDFEPTPDGNFIAAGQINADNPNVEPDVYGWLYKVSPVTLDSLWSLKLTAPIPNVQQSGNYLGGVGVLSSGNMVAGGYSQSGNNIYCWLVKFTPDGCVDTLWCATTPAWEPVNLEMQAEVKVWPNPTTDNVTIDFEKFTGNLAQGVLYNSIGQPISFFSVTSGQQNYTLQMEQLPAGIYWVVLRNEKGLVWNDKIIKQGQ